MKNNSIISQLKKSKRFTHLITLYKNTNTIFLNRVMNDCDDERVLNLRKNVIKMQFEYLDKFLLENLNIKIDKSIYKISEMVDGWIREYLIEFNRKEIERDIEKCLKINNKIFENN